MQFRSGFTRPAPFHVDGCFAALLHASPKRVPGSASRPGRQFAFYCRKSRSRGGRGREQGVEGVRGGYQAERRVEPADGLRDVPEKCIGRG